MALRLLLLLAVAASLSACVVKTETVTGTIVYPPGTKAEAPDSYGTEAERPSGAAARPTYERTADPYQHAVLCAAAQSKLLDLNSYMLTRQGLYDMEDAIDAWTDIALTEGADRGYSETEVRSEIRRTKQSLSSRQADHAANGCVVSQ